MARQDDSHLSFVETLNSDDVSIHCQVVLPFRVHHSALWILRRPAGFLRALMRSRYLELSPFGISLSPAIQPEKVRFRLDKRNRTWLLGAVIFLIALMGGYFLFQTIKSNNIIAGLQVPPCSDVYVAPLIRDRSVRRATSSAPTAILIAATMLHLMRVALSSSSGSPLWITLMVSACW